VAHNILITGSQGYIGKRLVTVLKEHHTVVGIDIVPTEGADYPYYQVDVRSNQLVELIRQHEITHVVHLASILQPSNNPERDYDIDVNGTKNVLQACVITGVEHLTVTSSGAAYGYHPDNPEWLTEQHTLRGNDEFAYSRHKRLIEELLSQYREQFPKLKQLVLRPGTVLGKTTKNQITALFNKPRLVAIKGSASPFVFIWDEDVLAIILRGVEDSKEGRYNLAGDGALTLKEIAQILNKPLLTLPAWLLKLALRLGKLTRLGRYGPEQINFLRYRPVLSNTLLKEQFINLPTKTSAEVFAYYLAHNQELLDNDK